MSEKTITEAQLIELRKPLDKSKVKDRKQGWGTVDYVEAWQSIDEANRIFNFDWSRETIYCKEVCRYEVTIGKENKAGWKVGYEAKVRITVAGVVKEGTGHGCGTMTDLFDCIESAAKEAESDAMKRALMMLGYGFGLALYDKERKFVEDVKLAPKVSKAPKVDNNAEAEKLKMDIERIFEMNLGQGAATFKAWWGAEESKVDRAKLKTLDIESYNKIVNKYKAAVDVFIKQSEAVT